MSQFFIELSGNVGIGTTAPGAKLEISDGTTALQIRPGELNGVTDASAVTLEYPGNGTIGIWDSLAVDQGFSVNGQLTARSDYYGFGHVFLYAFEGENNSGTAYLQARDNSGTSSIGLQLRTQNAGNIVDTMYLSPVGDVRVGATNSRFNVNTAGAPNVTSIIRARSAADIAFVVEDQNGTANMKVGSFGIECSVGTGFKPGGGSWAVLSDARLKHNIQPLTGALDSLLQLRSVTYEYNDPAATQQPAGKQTGFIAQEVEKVFPEWVGEKADGYKFIDIRGFESLTVQSLRELRAEKDAEIAALKAELAALKAANTALETGIAARLAKLEAASASTTVTTTPVSNAAIEAK